MVDRVLWFPSLNYNNAPPKARPASLLSPLVQHFRLRLLLVMTTYYVCRGRMFVAFTQPTPVRLCLKWAKHTKISILRFRVQGEHV